MSSAPAPADLPGTHPPSQPTTPRSADRAFSNTEVGPTGFWGVEHHRRAKVLCVVALGLHTAAFGSLQSTIPEFVTKNFYGGSESAASFFFSVQQALFAGVQLLILPPAGTVSDRFGRRPLMVVSTVGFLICCIMVSLSRSQWVLLAATLVNALSGTVFAMVFATLADISSSVKIRDGAADSVLLRNFGYVGIAVGFGFTAGPVTGGLLTRVDIRAPFYFATALAALNFLAVTAFFPESLAYTHRSKIRLQQCQPFYNVAILTRWRFGGLMVLVSFLIGISMGAFSVLPLYGRLQFGWKPLDFGIFLGCAGMLSLVWQSLGLYVVLKLLPERLILFGSLTATLLFLVVTGVAVKGWQVFGALLLCSIMFVWGPVARGITTRQYSDPAEQGKVQVSLSNLFQLQSLIGNSSMNALFGFAISKESPIYLPGAPFLFCAGLCAMALGILVLVLMCIPEPYKQMEHTDSKEVTPGEGTPLIK